MNSVYSGDCITSFNPRSRKGNDECSPVKASFLTLFQSTFPQGERQNAEKIRKWRDSFNPRSRKGNDSRQKSPISSMHKFQSTFPQGERPRHVPARGTTVSRSICSSLSKSFNPRSRKGNDSPDMSLHVIPHSFQSTFPQGERQQSSINFLYISCYYLCNYTNIIPVMQAQLTILISLYLNITVRISQTLYAHFCFAPIRYCIAALFNITKTTITLCS